MNEQHEISEKEINLIDLLFYCLEKWRWIVIAMLILGLLAGGYKYQATVRDNQSKQKTAVKEEEDAEIEEKDINEQSVESYKQALKGCESDVEKQKEYLDNSVVMQIDSRHAATGTLSYYIDGGEHLDSLIAAYRAYITDGRMAEALYEKKDDVPVADLRYLISFTNGEREAYRLDNNQVLRPEELIFQIRIEMPDEKLCEKYLEASEELIKSYSSQLQKSVAKHSLKLLASVQSELMDYELQNYQTTVWNTYVETVRKLQTLQTELDTVESLTEETAETSESSEVVLANPITSAVKYLVVGVVGGAFLICFAVMLQYIMSGRLQDTREFTREFGMPMLGLIKDSGSKKRRFGFIDLWIFRLEEGAYARLGSEEQIKLTAANIHTSIAKEIGKKEIKKIMIAGTVEEKEAASLYSRLTEDMQEISWSPYMQIVFRADALEELENYDGIIFIEKRRVSDARFILKERKLALDRDVKVLGTVVMC